MRKPKSQDHRFNISKSRKGISKSEDHRVKLSIAYHSNPVNKQNLDCVHARQIGVSLSETHRNTISKSLSGRKRKDFSEDHKIAISTAKGGKIWITNGSCDKCVSPETPLPLGWKRGRSNYNRINARFL